MSLLPAEVRWDFDKNLSEAQFLAQAIELGQLGLGLCAPNPAVGALIVKDGIIVGRGLTKPGGRPHAETVALKDAGDKARGATLFVSLEPCSHHGRTPPCTHAIIEAGIKRVVYAQRDPDPRVSGRGDTLLHQAGIETSCGLLAREALRANFGFFSRINRGRPMLTVKLAMTADGYAASLPGQPRLKITGAAADRFTHAERAAHDAILTSSVTVLSDDPLLTVRLPGFEERRPLRIILDSQLAISPTCRLAMTAMEVPTLLVANTHQPRTAGRDIRQAGIEIEFLGLGEDGKLDLSQLFQNLGKRGLTRVFAEAGPRLSQALILGGFADVVILLRSGKSLNTQGILALNEKIEAHLADQHQYEQIETLQLGEDSMMRFEKVF